MPQSNFIKNLPGALLRQNAIAPAVQFGEARRDYNSKAFPFWYSFVRSPYIIGDPSQSLGPNQAEGIYNVSAADAEGPDGLAIAAGGTLNIPIVMDRDTNFHLLCARYGAFRVTSFTLTTTAATDTFAQVIGDLLVDSQVIYLASHTTTTGPLAKQKYYVVGATATTFQISYTDGGLAITLTNNGSAVINRVSGRSGSREHLMVPYTNTAPALPGQGLVPRAATNARIPYWTALDVSLYLPSSGARDLYGGFQRDALGGAVQETPIPIRTLQGKQDGLGMLRVPYQLTKSATVNIRIRSNSAFPLRVYGFLFGYKLTG